MALSGREDGLRLHRAPRFASNESSVSVARGHNWTEGEQQTGTKDWDMPGIVHSLNLYYVPVAMLFGILSNILFCTVIRNSPFRRISPAPLILSIAIVDTVYLLVAGLGHLDERGWLITNDIPGLCQIMRFIKKLCERLGLWHLLLTQSERYLAMWHPASPSHQGKECKSLRRCTVASYSLSATFIFFYSTELWTTGLYKNRHLEQMNQFTDDGNTPVPAICMFLPRFNHVANVYTRMDDFLFGVLPYILLPILNLMITVQLIIKGSSLCRQENPNPVSEDMYVPREANQTMRRIRLQLRLTASLLLLSWIIWGTGLAVNIHAGYHFFVPSGTLPVWLVGTKNRQDSMKIVYLSAFALKFYLFLILSGVFRSATYVCARTYRCPCYACKEEDEPIVGRQSRDEEEQSLREDNSTV